jgi:hypothetical protein
VTIPRQVESARVEFMLWTGYLTPHKAARHKRSELTPVTKVSDGRGVGGWLTGRASCHMWCACESYTIVVYTPLTAKQECKA